MHVTIWIVLPSYPMNDFSHFIHIFHSQSSFISLYAAFSQAANKTFSKHHFYSSSVVLGQDQPLFSLHNRDVLCIYRELNRQQLTACQ